MRKSIPTPTTETPAPDAVALPSISSLPSLPPIPDGWEAKATMVDQCIGLGKRLLLRIAECIAKARVEDFPQTDEGASAWVSACVDRWGWEKHYVHKLRSVGAFLEKHTNKLPVSHEILCSLDYEKLLAMSRLPDHLVGPFLEKARPQDHSRDEVRAAVNRWLKAAGEPTEDAPAPTHTSRTQYDFLDLLFAPPAKVDDPQVFHDQVHARAGSVSAGAAQLIAFRSVVCLDAMVPRMDAGKARDLAAALRELAEEADKQAAKGV